ncbi:hypothetical protein FOZ61_001402 [Perkinsus olseni]|uniref:MULE transposase domain-containing protein n=1 Tax=Perkinsus olseni TaxID=32597 RepID=A0A7J6KQK7_PEROL|nr:hypothetical protein FOZ61_001402 [Perkinsus olseni]
MEKAAIKAFVQFWPRARVVICLFHFGQALYRKFGQLKFWKTSDGQAEENRERAFYNLMSLPFLPESKLLLGFKCACSTLPRVESETVMTYFRSHYGFLKFFSPQRWSQRERVIEDLPRTNNGQEGFHRRWNSLFRGTAHPNFWVWIEVVHDVFAENRLDLVRFENDDIPQRKPFYVRTDQLLYDLCCTSTDDLTEANIDQWFHRARGITRRLVPRTDLDKDADDLYLDVDVNEVGSHGTQTNEPVVLHIPMDTANDGDGLPAERVVELLPSRQGATDHSQSPPVQPTQSGEQSGPEAEAQPASAASTWVEHDVAGARWIVTEEDHSELMKAGEMIADRVVDTVAHNRNVVDNRNFIYRRLKERDVETILENYSHPPHPRWKL